MSFSNPSSLSLSKARPHQGDDEVGHTAAEPLVGSALSPKRIPLPRNPVVTAKVTKVTRQLLFPESELVGRILRSGRFPRACWKTGGIAFGYHRVDKLSMIPALICHSG